MVATPTALMPDENEAEPAALGDLGYAALIACACIMLATGWCCATNVIKHSVEDGL
jgi:hypothetical protein